jgi:hypothetical protein
VISCHSLSAVDVRWCFASLVAFATASACKTPRANGLPGDGPAGTDGAARESAVWTIENGMPSSHGGLDLALLPPHAATRRGDGRGREFVSVGHPECAPACALDACQPPPPLVRCDRGVDALDWGVVRDRAAEWADQVIHVRGSLLVRQSDFMRSLRGRIPHALDGMVVQLREGATTLYRQDLSPMWGRPSPPPNRCHRFVRGDAGSSSKWPSAFPTSSPSAPFPPLESKRAGTRRAKSVPCTTCFRSWMPVP